MQAGVPAKVQPYDGIAPSPSPTEQSQHATLRARADGFRFAYTHNRRLNVASSNRTSTAKYTYWNFIPKNLFEQFRRLANIYFLCIGMIQATTDLSPTSRYNTLIPLILVIAVNGLREFFEDLKRHRLDRQENARRTHVLRENGHLEPVSWSSLQVGDIVVVADGEEFPADLVLLAAEHTPTAVAGGVGAGGAGAFGAGKECVDVFVETANLDGESALKVRHAIAIYDPSLPLHADVSLNTAPHRERALRLSELPSVRLRAEYEPPSNQLYSLVGSARLCGPGGEPSAEALPFGMDSMLLRGMTLRNTYRAYGLVLYTGADLRSVRNSVGTPSKRSNVEKRIDESVLLLFGCLLVLCVVSSVLAYMEVTLSSKGHWYINESAGSASWTLLVSNLILFNNLVPISLYVTVELIKLVMSRAVEEDRRMWAPGTGQPASSRTSNLHEDLGQIKYVFTDKTGTLTMNEMVFSRCSIAGTVYGAPPSSAAAAAGGVGEAGAERGGAGVRESGESGEEEGAGARADGRGARASSISLQRSVESADGSAEDSATFDPTLLRREYLQGGRAAARIGEFMTVVCTCHSALPVWAGAADGGSVRSGAPSGEGAGAGARSEGAGGRGELTFKSASPDEGALLMGAAAAGWECVHAQRSSLVLRVFGSEVRYEVLAVNAFSANRKRMSVLLREVATGKFLTCCKGADDVMLERVCAPEEDAPAGPGASGGGFAAAAGGEGGEGGAAASRQSAVWVGGGGSGGVASRASGVWQPGKPSRADAGGTQQRSVTLNHIYDFATRGLRTLIFAIAYPTEEEANEWLARYREAGMAGQGREERLEAVAALLEVDMKLVGASAIEDRLQPGVPATISALQGAGIRFWMLTGDKLETAINVATAAHLITRENPILIVAAPDADPTERALLAASGGSASQRGGASGASFSKAVAGKMLARLSELEQYLRHERSRSMECAIVIDGRSLAIVLEHDSLQRKLVSMSQQCTAVIVCRVSPLHKALAIRLVKAHVSPTPLTLAIGDGANDVAMIQEADVGVGIHGFEGTQATRASDYSLAQFRFLARLLLVHGRHNYRRVCLTFLYSFYKNITMVLTLFLFGVDSRFSGAALYDGYLLSAFNVFFTALPIIAYGLFEQDVSAAAIGRFTALYRDGQKGLEMNPARMLLWTFEAVVHALVIYFGGTACLGLYTRSGSPMDNGVHGTAINGILVLAVSAKLWLQISHWTLTGALFCAVSVAMWPIFCAVYSVVGIVQPSPEFWVFHSVGTRTMTLPAFWLSLLLVPVFALTGDVVCAYVRANYFPTARQIVLEIDRGYGEARAWLRAIARTGAHDGASFMRAQTQGSSFRLGGAPPLFGGGNVQVATNRGPAAADASDRGSNERGAAAAAVPAAVRGSDTIARNDADAADSRRASLQLVVPPASGARIGGMPAGGSMDEAAACGGMANTFGGGNGSGGALAGEEAVGKEVEVLLLRKDQLAFEESIEAILREERAPSRHVAQPNRPVALALAYAVWFSCVDSAAALRSALHWRARRTAASPGTMSRSGSSPQFGGRSQRMHPLTLSFEDEPLEASFMAAFVERNYRIALFSMVAFELVLAVHLAVGIAVPLAEGRAIERRLQALTGALMLLVLAYVAWLKLSAVPRRYFEALNIASTMIIGYATLVALNSARDLVMLVFPVFAFLVAAVRWKRTVPMVVLHHPVYLVLEYFEYGGNDPFLTFYWVIIFATMVLVARMLEVRERRDFLLQQRLLQTKQRNDAILDNMLPPHVNAQRKKGNGVIANNEPSVTVLFCDIQDFKQIVKENSPAQLIRLLDSIYSAMDVVSDRLQVTKMETVGYTYMAAAGLQGAPASARGHAYDATKMAFEVLRVVAGMRAPNGRRIIVRIGLNSGNVLSGVVGDSKPQYCLFGDTVNTAARMQAKGERMEVHMSTATREQLRLAGADDEYDFVPRQVMAKGLGMVDTFLCREKGHSGASEFLSQPAAPLGSGSTGAGKISLLRITTQGGGGALPPVPKAVQGSKSMLITPSVSVIGVGNGASSCGIDSSQLSPAQSGDNGIAPASHSRDDSRASAAPATQGFACRLLSCQKESSSSASINGQSSPSAFGAHGGSADAGGLQRAATGGSALGSGALMLMGESQRRAEEAELRLAIRAWDLRFLGEAALLETVFVKSTDVSSLSEMRTVLGIFALGQMGFIVLEGVISLHENPLKKNSAYVAMASACSLLLAVFATYAPGRIESALRMSPSEAATVKRIRLFVLLTYVLYGALIPIAQIAKDERFGANSSAVLIFSAALLASSGGTRFLEVVGISSAWFVVWCACGGAGGFLVHVGGQQVDGHDSTPPALQTLLVLLLCTLLAVSYSSYVGEYSRRRLQLLLYRMHKELQRTDELLHNMMPVSVVAKLKENVQVADTRQGVLLLYSDIEGFTAMSKETSPTEVIRMLKHLYTIFDALVLQYDLFKVQTIGDAYIIMSNVGSAATGREQGAQASLRKAEQDAQAMVRMAFDMIRTIHEYPAPHKKPLRMRIGIHYGSVAAGVIGTKKLRYDIFGTDALLGNALESNGVSGGVVVSEAVLPLLARLHRSYSIVPHELVRLVEDGEFIGETMSYRVHPAKGFALQRLLMRGAFGALAARLPSAARRAAHDADSVEAAPAAPGAEETRRLLARAQLPLPADEEEKEQQQPAKPLPAGLREQRNDGPRNGAHPAAAGEGAAEPLVFTVGPPPLGAPAGWGGTRQALPLVLAPLEPRLTPAGGEKPPNERISASAADSLGEAGLEGETVSPTAALTAMVWPPPPEPADADGTAGERRTDAGG